MAALMRPDYLPGSLSAQQVMMAKTLGDLRVKASLQLAKKKY
jgi:hypothetical protein